MTVSWLRAAIIIGAASTTLTLLALPLFLYDDHPTVPGAVITPAHRDILVNRSVASVVSKSIVAITNKSAGKRWMVVGVVTAGLVFVMLCIVAVVVMLPATTGTDQASRDGDEERGAEPVEDRVVEEASGGYIYGVVVLVLAGLASVVGCSVYGKKKEEKEKKNDDGSSSGTAEHSTPQGGAIPANSKPLEVTVENPASVSPTKDATIADTTILDPKPVSPVENPPVPPSDDPTDSIVDSTVVADNIDTDTMDAADTMPVATADDEPLKTDNPADMVAITVTKNDIDTVSATPPARQEKPKTPSGSKGSALFYLASTATGGSSSRRTARKHRHVKRSAIPKEEIQANILPEQLVTSTEHALLHTLLTDTDAPSSPSTNTASVMAVLPGMPASPLKPTVNRDIMVPDNVL